MSIKDLVSPKEHILEARGIAESIFKNRPEIQLEMLGEVKSHLIKLSNNNTNRIEEI